MKSTGELIAFGKTFDEALAKAVKWNSQYEHIDHEHSPEIYVDAESELTSIIKTINLAGVKTVTAEDGIAFSDWLKKNRGCNPY